ncbi:MAG: hypothetical protein FD127_2232 [Acidimicrobiaceae bacterium]|nr:MAG: hypothetical protein FD127_2232 [Acidimicrobiaceae bacterium]
MPGAATRLTTYLGSFGFQMTEPTDGAGYEEFLDVTKIYFWSEAEAVAKSVARAMGGGTLAPMPTPAPIVGAMVGLGDAGVLVMLGRDLAPSF